jgi:multiple sugar transport system substrate-binding protein
MKAEKIIRRSLFWLSGLFILATMAASCAPADPVYGDLENLDPSGQFVTYWYQHSGDREQILQSMIAKFNATNEWGIMVQGEHAGSYGEIYSKIVDGIRTGQVPQMTVAYQNQAAIYATMDGIVELTPYIESPRWGFSEAELQDFFPFVELGDYLPEFDGRYGFPPQRSMEVLYYNEDWLRQLGYDHPPRTWEEFEEMACAASDSNAGTYGYVLSVDASTFADMLFNHGGSMINADATGYAFGDQAGLEVVTFLHNLHEAGCLVVESDVYEDRTEFSEGRALFTFSSTSGLPEYRRSVAEGADFNWSISTMPTSLGTPRVNVYGASLSIMRTTPEKQLASWLFIKWLTEPEQTAQWARSSNYFPVRRSAAEDLKDYFVVNPEYEKAFSFLNYDIAIEPGIASYQECRGPISEMFEAAALGGDPATLLKNALDECNAFWDEFSQQE